MLNEQQKQILFNLLPPSMPAATKMEWIKFIDELDLNPFIGEAIAMPSGFYITNKGLLKLLQKSGRYDGHEYEWGFDNNGNLMYVDVKLYLKDLSHPVVERAWLRDYQHIIARGKGRSAWNTSTYDMLAVKAMNKAIRRGLGLQITSAEEVMDINEMKEAIAEMKAKLDNVANARENIDYMAQVLAWMKDLSDKYGKETIQALYQEVMNELGLKMVSTEEEYDKFIKLMRSKLANLGGE